jgi:hypothetical protein
MLFVSVLAFDSGPNFVKLIFSPSLSRSETSVLGRTAALAEDEALRLSPGMYVRSSTLQKVDAVGGLSPCGFRHV